MSESEGYDVLRLIEHNRTCYISSDYVRGRPLIHWAKYHPNLSKKQLFTWIHEMARQLECIHNCRGNPCYRYVNPYSIIVTEQKELYFLDMNAESNGKMLLIMRRRSVREHFLPSEEGYYQTGSVSLDLYGLARTIQYLLSVSEPDPPLTKREERRLQKIISKCLNRHSGRTYGQVSEFRRQIPTYREQGKHITGKQIALIAAALLSASGAVIASGRGEGEPSGAEEQANDDISERPEAKVEAGEEARLRKELGFLCFLDKKDYERSREYFSGIPGDEPAEGMAELAGYMLAGTAAEAAEAEELDGILKTVEEQVPEEERFAYYRCLIEGYRMSDDADAAETVIRLAENCMDGADEQVRRELTAYTAAACEKTGELSRAIEKYDEMLSWESAEENREELYKKQVLLWEALGEKDRAGSVCREGIEELRESAELRLMHIRLQCADPAVEREICAQTVRTYIEEMPEITEEEEFGKLMQEYDIVVEGGNVWVGR